MSADLECEGSYLSYECKLLSVAVDVVSFFAGHANDWTECPRFLLQDLLEAGGHPRGFLANSREPWVGEKQLHHSKPAHLQALQNQSGSSQRQRAGSHSCHWSHRIFRRRWWGFYLPWFKYHKSSASFPDLHCSI